MSVLFYLSCVCIYAYTNVFTTTIIKQTIKIILLAGVPSSQPTFGFPRTAPSPCSKRASACTDPRHLCPLHFVHNYNLMFFVFFSLVWFGIQFSSVQSHLFLSPIGARTINMPVPYSTQGGFFFLGVVSTQLAFRVQPKRTQVEAQYWGNPEVARLEGTPAIWFWSRYSHTQIYRY